MLSADWLPLFVRAGVVRQDSIFNASPGTSVFSSNPVSGTPRPRRVPVREWGEGQAHRHENVGPLPEAGQMPLGLEDHVW